MRGKLDSMATNQVLKLVVLSCDRKYSGIKWVFKVNHMTDVSTDKYCGERLYLERIYRILHFLISSEVHFH